MASVNTNMGSLVAQANMGKQERAMNTAMERLSSGLRINSAADDAAGSAIASKLTSQVKSLGQAIRNANDDVHCYMLPRKNHVLGRWVKNGGLYPDWQYRLFKRKYGRWESKDVHANVIVSGRIEKLDLNIIHNGMPNISKQLSNLNRYTRYETDILIHKNIKFSYLKMIVNLKL